MPKPPTAPLPADETPWFSKLPAAPTTCAICGRRHHQPGVHLPFGIVLSLCERHNTDTYLCAEGGLRFARKITRIWSANGTLTRTRTKALAAHLRTTHRAAQGRPLPGSYAYKRERSEVEHRLANGDDLQTIVTDIRNPARWGQYTPPSERTIRRWYQDRRWVKPPIAETLRALGQPLLDALEILVTFANPGNFADWISFTKATPAGQQRYDTLRAEQRRRRRRRASPETP